MHPSPSNRLRQREGAALLIALWVILVLSLLVGSFAFDMHIESRITGFYRQRMKAGFASRGGVELAKLMLAESAKGSVSAQADIEDLEGLEKEIAIADERLEKGASVVVKQTIGPNKVELEIIPAESRWNVNMLTEEQWEVLLETTGVPEEDWDELLDAFYDWTDENDLVRLNGAESDDAFYEDAGYKVKNGPLDTVQELLLIKGFTEELVYGTPPSQERDEDEPFMTGIAWHLSTWSDGCISPNAASFDTLLSMGMYEEQAEEILTYRRGDDGIDGTEDDELFQEVQEVLNVAGLPDDMAQFFCIQDVKFFRVKSTGISGGDEPVRQQVSCILKREDKKAKVVAWFEGSE